MNKKLVYATSSDKKILKKLAKDLKPALISLAQKQPMSWLIPTYDIILEIHDAVLDISGGKSGVQVESYIHKAVERPKTYTNYVEEYDLDTVCALLIDSIARYHGFNDGNKRTALMTAIMTYRLNGVHFVASIEMNKQFDDLVMQIVTQKPDIKTIEVQLKKLRNKFEAKDEQSLFSMLLAFVNMRFKKEQDKKQLVVVAEFDDGAQDADRQKVKGEYRKTVGGV